MTQIPGTPTNKHRAADAVEIHDEERFAIILLRDVIAAQGLDVPPPHRAIRTLRFVRDLLIGDHPDYR